jgi:hypothetical protein
LIKISLKGFKTILQRKKVKLHYKSLVKWNDQISRVQNLTAKLFLSIRKEIWVTNTFQYSSDAFVSKCYEFLYTHFSKSLRAIYLRLILSSNSISFFNSKRSAQIARGSRFTWRVPPPFPSCIPMLRQRNVDITLENKFFGILKY